LASDTMVAMISLIKDEFCVGEAIPITFDIDNSQCGRDVKSLKIKFMREVVTMMETGMIIPVREYLEEIKIPCDVKGKTKASKKIVYNIPATIKPEKLGNTDGLPPHMVDLAKTLSVSQYRPLFQIKYKLDLFIKHKSKTEFGQGNAVSFPIVIR